MFEIGTAFWNGRHCAIITGVKRVRGRKWFKVCFNGPGTQRRRELTRAEIIVLARHAQAINVGRKIVKPDDLLPLDRRWRLLAWLRTVSARLLSIGRTSHNA